MSSLHRLLRHNHIVRCQSIQGNQKPNLFPNLKCVLHQSWSSFHFSTTLRRELVFRQLDKKWRGFVPLFWRQICRWWLRLVWLRWWKEGRMIKYLVLFIVKCTFLSIDLNCNNNLQFILLLDFDKIFQDNNKA